MNNIRYGDDIGLLAHSAEKLQAMVTKMQESCERKSLKKYCRKKNGSHCDNEEVKALGLK